MPLFLRDSIADLDHSDDRRVVDDLMKWIRQNRGDPCAFVTYRGGRFKCDLGNCEVIPASQSLVSPRIHFVYSEEIKKGVVSPIVKAIHVLAKIELLVELHEIVTDKLKKKIDRVLTQLSYEHGDLQKAVEKAYSNLQFTGKKSLFSFISDISPAQEEIAKEITRIGGLECIDSMNRVDEVIKNLKYSLQKSYLHNK